MKNDDNKRLLTLGIDIGGTNTAFAAVDAEGGIIARGSIPTPGDATFSLFIIRLHKAVSDIMRQAGLNLTDIAAIGVGAPCLNPSTGVVEGAVDLPWPSPLPLRAALEEAFKLPVASENDANAAALGELCYGAARGLDNFIMLTLGTGVGSAIVCDGHLLHGIRGMAGELGHLTIRRGEDARPCTCGRNGCLETYLSARGVVESARQILASDTRPSILRGKEPLHARDIGEAASAGDEIALETLRQTGRILGEVCAAFTTFSSPSAFIFFGGVANSYPLMEATMKEEYERNLLWVYKGQTRFLLSSLPSGDAALLGIAAVARMSLQPEK